MASLIVSPTRLRSPFSLARQVRVRRLRRRAESNAAHVETSTCVPASECEKAIMQIRLKKLKQIANTKIYIPNAYIGKGTSSTWRASSKVGVFTDVARMLPFSVEHCC